MLLAIMVVLNSSDEHGLDGANSERHQSGKVVTSLEVRRSVPISLESGDIGLDLFLVEGVVLGEGSRELGGVGEDLGPRLNGSDVFIHVLAGVEGLGNLQDCQAELKCGLGVVVPATLLDIGDSSLDLLGHERNALIAGLDLGQLVVPGHTVDEASDEIGGIHDSKVGNLVGFDGADGKSHQSSEIISSLEVRLCVPIRFQSFSVRLDLLLVERPVLGERGGEFGWVGEDLGPCLDSSDVLIHALAGAQSLGDLQGCKTEL